MALIAFVRRLLPSVLPTPLVLMLCWLVGCLARPLEVFAMLFVKPDGSTVPLRDATNPTLDHERNEMRRSFSESLRSFLADSDRRYLDRSDPHLTSHPIERFAG